MPTSGPHEQGAISHLCSPEHPCGYGAMDQGCDKAIWQRKSAHRFPNTLITDPAARLEVTWDALRANNDQHILWCPRSPNLVLEHSRQGSVQI